MRTFLGLILAAMLCGCSTEYWDGVRHRGRVMFGAEAPTYEEQVQAYQFQNSPFVQIMRQTAINNQMAQERQRQQQAEYMRQYNIQQQQWAAQEAQRQQAGDLQRMQSDIQYLKQQEFERQYHIGGR